MSKGEGKIVQILNSAKISFEREKRFNDLKKGLFRFDFYIYGNKNLTNCCIEYQGEQHYQYIKLFYPHYSDFKKAQGRDMQKIEYCLLHKIPLYIIPYWEFDNLHSLPDVLNPRFLATSVYKNFDDFRKICADKKFEKL